MINVRVDRTDGDRARGAFATVPTQYEEASSQEAMSAKTVAIAMEIGRHVDSAAAAEDREALARNIQALRPADPLAQHAVADIVLGRLKVATKRDADIAQILFPALGDGHKSARRLNDAIHAVDKADKLNLTDRDRDALRAAKLNHQPPSSTTRRTVPKVPAHVKSHDSVRVCPRNLLTESHHLSWESQELSRGRGWLGVGTWRLSRLHPLEVEKHDATMQVRVVLDRLNDPWVAPKVFAQ